MSYADGLKNGKRNSQTAIDPRLQTQGPANVQSFPQQSPNLMAMRKGKNKKRRVG